MTPKYMFTLVTYRKLTRESNQTVQSQSFESIGACIAAYEHAKKDNRVLRLEVLAILEQWSRTNSY